MAFTGLIFLWESWLNVKVLNRFWEKERKESVFLSWENTPSPSPFGMKNWSWERC